MALSAAGSTSGDEGEAYLFGRIGPTPPLSPTISMSDDADINSTSDEESLQSNSDLNLRLIMTQSGGVVSEGLTSAPDEHTLGFMMDHLSHSLGVQSREVLGKLLTEAKWDLAEAARLFCTTHQCSPANPDEGGSPSDPTTPPSSATLEPISPQEGEP